MTNSFNNPARAHAINEAPTKSVKRKVELLNVGPGNFGEIMKEHPIIFGAESIRAILESRKTMTRRIIKPQPESVIIDEKTVYVRNGISSQMRWFKFDYLTNGKIEYLRPAVNERPTKKKAMKAADWLSGYHRGDVKWSEDEIIGLSKYGKSGDRLWVREIWGKIYRGGFFSEDIIYKADRPSSRELVNYWRSPIHMPRKASRITLEITNIRVEQIGDINIDGACAEGLTEPTDKIVDAFISGWDKLNAKRGFSWEKNPWVWVIEFKRVNQ